MANNYFRFKKFVIHQDRAAMKVTTDSCFFGAWAAKEIQREESTIKNVLDIGAGTGLLSLMVAQLNGAEIDSVEIDNEAAEQAKENVNLSLWEGRIHVFNEDILSFGPGKKYDCIISNPPFYENELASQTGKKNIAHHSYQLTIAQVLKTIKMHLIEDGIFFLMYPFKRKEEIDALLKEHELYLTDSVFLSQSVKHSPFRIIVKGSVVMRASTSSTSLSIWDEHQQYTKAFVDLLKDYYLYL